MDLRADTVQPELKMIHNADDSATRIPTEAQAKRQQRIRFMRVCTQPNRRLADKLENCHRGRRCKSEADPVCLALFQHKLCRAASTIVAGRSWTRTSVVSSDLLVPSGHLDDFDLAAIVERLRARLERSSLRKRAIIGVIDISVDLKNRSVIGWQLHLNFLVEGKNSTRLQAAIKALFLPGPTASFLFKEVINADQALASLYSYRFFRRSRYRVKKKFKTAKLPLTPNDLKEPLSFLGRYKIGSRFFSTACAGTGIYWFWINNRRGQFPSPWLNTIGANFNCDRAAVLDLGSVL